MITLPLDTPGLLPEAKRRATEFHDNAAMHGDAFCAPPPFRWEHTGGYGMEMRTFARLLGDLSRSDSRDFWLRWLAAGLYDAGAQPCACGRWTRFVGGTDADPEPECDACGKRPVYGRWVRPAWPYGWMRDGEIAENGETLTPYQSGRAIAWSVQNVVAGNKPLRGVARLPRAVGIHGRPRGIVGCNDVLRVGDEVITTCPRALALGYALRDDVGILTLPGLPLAPETAHATC